MAARLVLLAANLIPVIGVAFWGWDAFELLVLYWLETAVIAFWTLVQIGFFPERADAFLKPASRKVLRGPGRAVLFAVHIGVFMAAHMVFLWTLFAGAWRQQISGPISFVDTLVVGNGLWVPLLGLFAVRGLLVSAGLFGSASDAVSEKSVLHDLYARIITLHLTLIAGSWLVIFLDERPALLILVAIKILIDLSYDPFAGKRPQPA